MVKLTKIYTKSGDKGKTHLVDGSEVEKDSVRVQAYGEVDELNSWLGYLRTLLDKKKWFDLAEALALIQQDLFDIGSALATPADFSKYPVFEPTQDHVAKLERLIDESNSELTALESFVLPGGSQLNGLFHIARSVCRRAERNTISLSKKDTVHPNIIVYLNRLSDLLFVWARCCAKKEGAKEYLWKPAVKGEASE